MNEPRNESQEVRMALSCPLQRQQAGEVPICMATWQETRVCTGVACVMYRKLAGLLDIRDALMRRIGQLEHELSVEREQLQPKDDPRKIVKEANTNG